MDENSFDYKEKECKKLSVISLGNTLKVVRLTFENLNLFPKLINFVDVILPTKNKTV